MQNNFIAKKDNEWSIFISIKSSELLEKKQKKRRKGKISFQIAIQRKERIKRKGQREEEI